MKKQDKFFIISFIPAIAYWYLEANYDLKIALIGGVGLATLEILFEKFILKHVHKISLLNFGLILFLGCIALLGDDGVWYRLQPLFTGIIMSTILFYKKYKGQSFLVEMMNDIGGPLPLSEDVIKILEFHMAIFLLSYGFFMGWIALYKSTETWLFYKTIGFYVAMFAFMLFELIYIKVKFKDLANNEK